MSKIKQSIVYVISVLLLLTDFYMLMNPANHTKLLYIPIVGISVLEIYMELFILPDSKRAKAFWIRWIIVILGTACLGIFSKDRAFHIFYLVAIFMLIRYGEGKQIGIWIGIIVALLGLIAYLGADSGYVFLVHGLKK